MVMQGPVLWCRAAMQHLADVYRSIFPRQARSRLRAWRKAFHVWATYSGRRHECSVCGGKFRRPTEAAASTYPW